jgi:hypothetical protein
LSDAFGLPYADDLPAFRNGRRVATRRYQFCVKFAAKRILVSAVNGAARKRFAIGFRNLFWINIK